MPQASVHKTWNNPISVFWGLTKQLVWTERAFTRDPACSQSSSFPPTKVHFSRPAGSLKWHTDSPGKPVSKICFSSSGSFTTPEISELLFFALMQRCMVGRINTWSNRTTAHRNLAVKMRRKGLKDGYFEEIGGLRCPFVLKPNNFFKTCFCLHSANQHAWE